MKHYLEQADAVLREVDSCEQGLTAAEAEERLAKNGKNKLEEGKKDSLIKRFFQQMADPMIIILLAAAAISAVLAVVENESFADVIIILFVVIVNAVLGVYQESKAEKAIEALQQMAAAMQGEIVQMQAAMQQALMKGDMAEYMRLAQEFQQKMMEQALGQQK